ncbi:MAG: DUF86 domain-containing protein [Actinomycetota bacterium]
MVREEIVRRKLAHLTGYLDELAIYADTSFDDYVGTGGPRRAVERLIQLVIESAVDINVHIATESAGSPPPDYRSSFAAVARCGAISGELAESLAPSAGLRNALTHDYATVDDARVHSAMPMVLAGFREYAASVTRWLAAQRA